MRVIHFTRGATDPLTTPDSQGAHFLPLADGEGEVHIGCVHLDPGAKIEAPSLTHAAALLVVHGRIIVMTSATGARIGVSGGVGCVFDKNEPYSLESEIGAIVSVLESDTLTAHLRGISSPKHIRGQTWPSDCLLPAHHS